MIPSFKSGCTAVTQLYGMIFFYKKNSSSEIDGIPRDFVILIALLSSIRR